MKRLIWNAGLSVFAAGLALAGDAAAGKAAYDKSCKGCHGPSGTPNASIAKSLKVNMLHLGDPAVQKLSDEELKSVLANGKGKMKATKNVSGKAADDVVAYMRTLKP
ncbi:MAG TPA: cytochrome c [Bryobacteraceae bacterium]|jgi:mono/diheme cytochrome c family protein|nr:cytochrome c [Bryobacteraceae bacterium]